jgi:hypothetical protein
MVPQDSVQQDIPESDQAANHATAPPALPPLRADAFTTPYRDPVWDGPTDPVLVPDHLTGEWVLFYTQRRATAPGLTGVEWVHGSAIGTARSSDGGLNWDLPRHRGRTRPAGNRTPGNPVGPRRRTDR